LDRHNAYPTEFVKELTTSGFPTVLIPEEYGGAGLGVLEAAAVMEEVCRSGAHAGPTNLILSYIGKHVLGLPRSC